MKKFELNDKVLVNWDWAQGAPGTVVAEMNHIGYYGVRLDNEWLHEELALPGRPLLLNVNEMEPVK